MWNILSDKVSKFDSEYLKEKREKRRKRQKQIQYSIFGVLLLIILLILIYMFTPLSKINNIEIKGNHNVSNSDIKKALKVNDNSRMYTYSTSSAEQRLKKETLMKKAKVTKHLPNKLTVEVTEDQVVGLINKKDKYVPITEDGTELENYKSDVSDDGPILDGFDNEQKNLIIKQLAKIPVNIRSSISEVSYDKDSESTNQIKIYTTDGLQIVGDMNTFGNKMKYYPQMSQSLERDETGELKNSGYIDLSVGASFIPYSNAGENDSRSATDQNVEKGSQQQDKAKNQLQDALNNIKKKTDKNN